MRKSDWRVETGSGKKSRVNFKKLGRIPWGLRVYLPSI